MAGPPPAIPTLAYAAGPKKRRSPLVDFARAQPIGAASFAFILVLLGASVFAPWIVPHDPFALDFGKLLEAPSPEHPFGTDNLGRDIFSRVLWGARTALAIGILSSLVGSILGGVIGVVSAYFGGRFDFLMQRFIDVLLSFPIIVLALVVVAMLGKRVWLGVDVNLIVAIAIPIVPKVARVVRAAALSVREMPYVDAARAAGYSDARIVFRHMVPNVFAPFLIMFTAFVAQAILLEASLSFLGLGVTEPTPAWGLMLAGNAADFYREAPWMIIFPGLAISLSVFAFNLFGDALRDHLDPRFKV
jgi:peptide/nickel transport system permease protein